MYINKVLCILTAQALFICKEKKVSLVKIDELTGSKMMSVGVFSISDSVGLKITSESINNFNSSRYDIIMTPLYNEYIRLLNLGYGGNKEKGIVDYYKENEVVHTNDIVDNEAIILELYSVIMNEIVYMLQNYTLSKSDIVLRAVESVIGLEFKSAYRKYGYESIRKSLKENYNKNQQQLYMAFAQEAYEKVFG